VGLAYKADSFKPPFLPTYLPVVRDAGLPFFSIILCIGAAVLLQSFTVSARHQVFPFRPRLVRSIKLPYPRRKPRVSFYCRGFTLYDFFYFFLFSFERLYSSPLCIKTPQKVVRRSSTICRVRSFQEYLLSGDLHCPPGLAKPTPPPHKLLFHFSYNQSNFADVFSSSPIALCVSV